MLKSIFQTMDEQIPKDYRYCHQCRKIKPKQEFTGGYCKPCHSIVMLKYRNKVYKKIQDKYWPNSRCIFCKIPRENVWALKKHIENHKLEANSKE